MKPLQTTLFLACVIAGSVLSGRSQDAKPEATGDLTIRTEDGHPVFQKRLGQVARRPKNLPPEAQQDVFTRYSVRESPRTRSLIVRNSEGDEKSLHSLQEDLAIMRRILEKNLKDNLEPQSVEPMGISMLVHGDRSVRNAYIEDYGALFVLSVNVPLVAEEKSEKKERAGGQEDSTWEETKREIQGKHRPFAPGWKEPRPKRRQFDPAELEHLQQVLIESLRNASNIRQLKPADSVTLVVNGLTGRGEQEDRLVESLDDESTGEVRIAIVGDATESSNATMVIRAKKSDIDEFAKKKDAEAFRKKVSITIY